MKQLSEYTDLELAEIASSQYQEFMRVQQNLIAINQEIQKRKAPKGKAAPVEQ